ncbi:MAG: hypothetical protein ACTS5P_00840 [Candidatus Hodgkinia cicadicola]
MKTVNEFRMESYNSMNEVNGAKLTNDWRLSAHWKVKLTAEVNWNCDRKQFNVMNCVSRN